MQPRALNTFLDPNARSGLAPDAEPIFGRDGRILPEFASHTQSPGTFEALRRVGGHEELFNAFSVAVAQLKDAHKTEFAAAQKSPAPLFGKRPETEARLAASARVKDLERRIVGAYDGIVTEREQQGLFWSPSKAEPSSAQLDTWSNLGEADRQKIASSPEYGRFLDAARRFVRASEDLAEMERQVRKFDGPFMQGKRDEARQAKGEAWKDLEFQREFLSAPLRRENAREAGEQRLAAGSDDAALVEKAQTIDRGSEPMRLEAGSEKFLSYRVGTWRRSQTRSANYLDSQLMHNGAPRRYFVDRLARLADAEDAHLCANPLLPSERYNWLTRLKEKGIKLDVQEVVMDDWNYGQIQRMAPGKERPQHYKVWLDGDTLRVRDALVDKSLNTTDVPKDAVKMNDLLATPESMERFMSVVRKALGEEDRPAAAPAANAIIGEI